MSSAGRELMVAVNSAYVRNGTSGARDSLDEGFLSFFRFFRPMCRSHTQGKRLPQAHVKCGTKQQRTAKNRWKRCVTLCVKSPL